VSAEPSSDNALICANCGALNPPNTLICRSCGVNLPQFRAAVPRLRELQSGHVAAYEEQLIQDAEVLVADQISRSRRDLRLRLRVALIAAAVLAVIIVIAAALYAEQVRLRRERLAAQYERAATCLADENYMCARDGFLALLEEEPGYPGARDGLNEARYRLAETYARDKEWEKAIEELDALLKDVPRDEAAIALMHDVFDRWIEDLMSRRDILGALGVLWQRNLRFPLGGR